jgi:hypothetical protein
MEIQTAKYINAEQTYKDKRKAEYPEIGDQLDALWKHDKVIVLMPII